jgi:adenylate kinase
VSAMRMVLLGAPGSGKGTQAVRLARSLQIVHISTGDIFRQAIQENTELGKKAKEFMNQGYLVPDDIVLNIIQERITKPDCQAGFIFDGFPRTLPQAEGLDSLLEKLSTPLKMVICLEIPLEKIIERLSSRRVCQKCGQDFNLIGNPPPADLIHPGCGGRIVQRDDDLPETIKKRLEVYQKQTKPLKQYYRNKKLLFEVDGFGTVDVVFSRMKKVVESN